MNARHRPLFSIGHSNRSPKRFLALLQEHGISEVADVRSSPYSHYNSQFNREALEELLEEHDIRYVFLGRELVLQRQFKVGCPRMPGGQRGVSRESG